MKPSYENQRKLQIDFEKIKKMRNPHKRGYAFEKLIYDLTRVCGFNSKRGTTKTQSGDQIDVYAEVESNQLIIETKFENKPLEAKPIRDLFGKLEIRPPNVVGVFFSMSGFTKGAKDYASDLLKKERLILLINQIEIENIFSGYLIDFEKFLKKKIYFQSKESKTYFHKDKSLNTDKEKKIEKDIKDEIKDKRHLLMEKRIPYLSTPSSAIGCILFSPLYYPFVSRSFKIEATINYLEEKKDFLKILKTYNDIFGISNNSSFCINQTNHTWFGMGVHNFIKALKNQKRRYKNVKNIKIHHSEAATFVDEIPGWHGGFFSFSMQPSTHIKRKTYDHIYISFILQDQPFSMKRYETFFEHLDLEVDCVEILDWPITGSINRKMFKNQHLDKVGYIKQDIENLRNEKWVSGIICKNPFYKKDLDIELRDSKSKYEINPFQTSDLTLVTDIKYIIVNFPSYHLLKDKNIKYKLREVRLIYLPSGGFSSICMNAVGNWEWK